MTAKGIIPCILSKANRKIPIPHNRSLCRQRHSPENMLGWLKDCRRIYPRYDRCAYALHVAICLVASVIFWINH